MALGRGKKESKDEDAKIIDINAEMQGTLNV